MEINKESYDKLMYVAVLLEKQVNLAIKLNEAWHEEVLRYKCRLVDVAQHGASSMGGIKQLQDAIQARQKAGMEFRYKQEELQLLYAY
jgi:hypothetical protein